MRIPAINWPSNSPPKALPETEMLNESMAVMGNCPLLSSPTSIFIPLTPPLNCRLDSPWMEPISASSVIKKSVGLLLKSRHSTPTDKFFSGSHDGSLSLEGSSAPRLSETLKVLPV